MGLDVLLEVLGTLERLPAGRALVRFEGDMHADMRCDVISLDRRGLTVAPLAGQVQVVGAFPTDMALADVFLGWSALRVRLPARKLT